MYENPGISQESYAPDQLFASDFPRITRNGTVLSGQNVARGTVMGRVTLGAATPAADAGNAANTGTIGAVTVGAGAKVGTYRVVCIEPASNAGKFIVEDPDGIIVGVATVAVAFSGGGLGFTISDGSQDFVSGEGFTIAVAAGSGKLKKAVAAATDGSHAPVGILVADTDASAADKIGAIYETGCFAEEALTLGAGLTIEGIRPALRALGIHMKSRMAF